MPVQARDAEDGNPGAHPDGRREPTADGRPAGDHRGPAGGSRSAGGRPDGASACDAHADDDEAVTLWGLVIEGYLATQERLLNEIADRFGLAPAQFDILLRLVRSPEQRLPMTRLAREAALTSGGFTKVADRMVEAGLIRRERCDIDRRVVYAALTGHGRRIAEGARAACAEIVRRTVIAPLGPNGSEQLAGAMRTLREANGRSAVLTRRDHGERTA